MFLHYIWDFDGTLFNSYPQMSHAFQHALKDMGYSHTTNEILMTMKLSVGKCVRYYQEKYNLSEELRERYRYYEKNENAIEIKPYLYLKEVLIKIVELGGKNYIYTHRGKSTMEYIRKFKLNQLFADAVTSDDKFPPKPAPDAILYLTEKHKMDKDKVVMIGDRDIDILAGHNAMVKGCLFDPDNYFPDINTDFKVKSMNEFEKVFLT